MTAQPKDKARVEKMVRAWQRRLHLEHYTIRVVFEAEAPNDTQEGAGFGDGARAEARPHYPYREADIVIFPQFWREDARFKEHVIAHELLHVIAAGVLDLIERQANGRAVSVDEARHVTEDMTEHLTAVVIAQELRRV